MVEDLVVGVVGGAFRLPVLVGGLDLWRRWTQASAERPRLREANHLTEFAMAGLEGTGGLCSHFGGFVGMDFGTAELWAEVV